MDRHSAVANRASERREHPRAPLDVPALYDTEATYGKAECRNVSAGGLAIAGSDFPVGTYLAIYFELPTGHAIDERARVVRRTGRELGLAFLAPSLETRAALRAYVVSRSGDLRRAS